MPKCSVVGCGARNNANQESLSLHRLPKSEYKKKKWLEAIGIENITPNVKDIFICSLHFPENAVNKTLDVIRLKDEAIPSRSRQPTAGQDRILKENKTEPNLVPVKSKIAIIATQPVPGTSGVGSLMLPVESTISTIPTQPIPGTAEVSVPVKSKIAIIATQPVPGTSGVGSLMLPVESTISTIPTQPIPGTAEVSVPVKSKIAIIATQPVPGTSGVGSLMLPVESTISTIPTQPIPGTAEVSEPMKVKKLERQVDCLRRKVRSLNEKVRRQKKKLANFQSIIKDLQERNLVNNDSSIVLEACAGPKDFLKRQILKSEGLPLERQYSEETRKFALTLHFFSPKAYDFVRRTYNTCLPHPRTLTKWYQKINAEPGFCKEAFEALKAKVEASTEPVVCALIFDEMSIRKSLCWDPQTKTYYGRVNVGNDSDNDSLEVASQCFVFLLNCINNRWKVPVGYFFITSLAGEQKAELLKMCVQRCEEIGVKIVSVTCDGPAANFSMFSELGCQLTKTQNKTTFTCSKSELHAFIDPCHAIKLVRNTFGDLRVLFDQYGRKIDFGYLEMLLQLQEQEGLHMATKITKAHLYFAKQKMKVRLATQLLSSSVADALEFCKTELHLKQFEDCEGTVNFIRILNDVFDVLNSHSVRPPGWKKAICPENVGFVEALFEGAIGYICSLKLLSGELVINSKRKTGFIGLVIDMKSALQLFRHLVQDTKILKYLPLYKVSQDHVELFFSAITARGGFNNNPNAVQLKAAFKRLIIRAEIRDGGLGNCIPLEQVNILNCSSTMKPTDALNELTDKYSFIEVSEDDSDLFDEYIDCLNGTLSKYAESVAFYIAGFVARKMSRSIKCETCIAMLLGDPKDNSKNLVKFKSRGGLIYPSKDLDDIIRKTERLVKLNLKKDMAENYYMYIFKFMMDYYFESSTDIFQSNSHDHDAKHKHLLIKSVIQTYLDIRFRYYGKKHTEKVSFRNYLNKIILFRNE